VYRREEDARVVLEHGLGPVAVVDVPVDDEDALRRRRRVRERGGDGDGDVIVEAEAHHAVALGVVARRPREGRRVVVRARRDGEDRVDRRARRQARAVHRELVEVDGVLPLGERRQIGLEAREGLGVARRHDLGALVSERDRPVDVRRLVDARELGGGRAARR